MTLGYVEIGNIYTIGVVFLENINLPLSSSRSFFSLQVGEEFGSIDILDLQSTIPRLTAPLERRGRGGKTSRPYSSITSRKTVEV